jgi:membrane protein required for colicin V production
MATLDIGIAVVIVLSAVIGLVRGLVKEVLSLASWVLAFLVALYFSGQSAEHLPTAWGSPTVRTGIAFVVLFVVTLILAAIAQWLISQLVATTGLSGTDRLLGFLFGSARGLIICIVALMGIREIAGDAQWWQASVLQGELLEFEDEVRDLLGRARDVVSEVPGPSV